MIHWVYIANANRTVRIVQTHDESGYPVAKCQEFRDCVGHGYGATWEEALADICAEIERHLAGGKP